MTPTPRITVLGVGADGLAPRARDALAAAGLVVGARRHLDAAGPPAGPTVELTSDLAPALEAVGRADGPVVVLASGDPGFFGIVRALAARFGRHALDVRPALSPVAATFAAAGLPWDDAVVVSAHGRGPAAAVATCLAHPKVAVLTGPGFGPPELARALRQAGAARTVVVAERLGEPNARITEGDLDAVADGRYAAPNVVLVLDEVAAVAARPATIIPARSSPAGWALPVDAFTHRGGMISKPEVRALALAALGPGRGDLVWDVGAGSGAVGIECARFGAAVVAVDRDPAAADLVRRNARAHGVAVQMVTGTAPAVLAGLPDPDASFVGGGGDDLAAILQVVAARSRRAVVVALATVERVAATTTALQAAGWAVSARLLQAAEVQPLAGGHRLAATNPVFVVQAQRR